MPTSKRVRETKVKTKTFTGCWTCRARKVKCDSHRPHCLRCTKAKLSCEGYDIKLYWVSDAEAENTSAIKRQAMSILDTTPPLINSSELDLYLTRLDQSYSRSSSNAATLGPFTVFGLQKNQNAFCADSPMPIWAVAFEEETLPASEHSSPLSSSDEGLSQTMTTFEDGEMTPDCSDSLELLQQPPVDEFMPSDISKNIYKVSLVNKLLDHYVQNVSAVLQPVIHRQNTYTTIYIPGALTGYQKLSLDLKSYTSDVVVPKIAIFFSLMSTSAFHLRGANMEAFFQEIGIDFRIRAQTYLRRAIDILPGDGAQLAKSKKLGPALQSEAILSAMLTLVTTDVMDGFMTEFGVHLEGARQISRRLRRAAQPNSNTEVLINIVRFLTIISETTLTTLSALPWYGEEAALSDGETFFGHGHGLVYTYGITTKLANFIHRITVLSRHIAHYVALEESLPESLTRVCRGLSASLYSWSLTSEDLSTIADDSVQTQWLAKQYLLACVDSIKIYFHTRVLPCTPSGMNSLIRSVAKYLNNIEETKERTGYNTVMTASISWPGFIASCEAQANAREAWRKWWNTVLQFRIGNQAELWSLVQEAWKLRDEGLNETPAWLPVLQQNGRKILAI